MSVRAAPRSKNLAQVNRAAYIAEAHAVGVGVDVEEFLKKIDRHLEPYLRRTMTMVPDITPIKEGVTYQVSTGGKRIRAALCVTSCELFCGTFLRALHFAAAVEHLQNFTLIHDDIADGDEERRGQRSIWRRYGVAHAINIGDVFASLSAIAVLDSVYSAEVKLRLVRLIAEFGLQIAEGQGLDINLRQNDAPLLQEYLECTRRKTGAFLALATVGGAIVGGASDEHLERLRQFALLAGTAFQIKDDLLDLTGGKGRMIGSDILEGKRTLFVVYIAQHGSRPEKKRLLSILNKPRVANTAGDIQWVCDLYERSGAVEYAERTAHELIEAASQHALVLPDSDAKYRLLRISKYLSQRIR